MAAREASFWKAGKAAREEGLLTLAVMYIFHSRLH